MPANGIILLIDVLASRFQKLEWLFQADRFENRTCHTKPSLFRKVDLLFENKKLQWNNLVLVRTRSRRFPTNHLAKKRTWLLAHKRLMRFYSLLLRWQLVPVEDLIIPL